MDFTVDSIAVKYVMKFIMKLSNQVHNEMHTKIIVTSVKFNLMKFLLYSVNFMKSNSISLNSR